MSAANLALAFSVLIALTACSFEGFRRLAIARNIVARPSPLVRSHTDPVPYLGGPALFAALLPALVVLARGEPAMPEDDPGTRWICTACMLAVGLADDLRPLRVGPKLIAQSAVCSIYLIAARPPASPRILSLGLELALMLLVVNAFNLVDVMDGLLIVVASLAAVGLLGGSLLTSPPNRIECWGLLAALAVAFPFNRPPARIYLGDAGALALGFFLASLYLTGTSSSARSVGLAHFVAFAIPLFEVALLTIARVRRGLSPFRGSPDHFALRLQDQTSWTPGRVLVATAAMGLFFDVWCFVPADRILGPIGVILAATSILLAVAAFLCCWRLAPRQASSRSSMIKSSRSSSAPWAK
jgi:UDP-GlcNAc:undecaprenyl-phosphate GlcNAc-1-phosphate transferase